MKKNMQKIPYTYHKVKGFTLIEFLVASMLAMIVIVAASSTYMITRKLNNSAQERISIQQDIRNAAVQLARDVRMAGSFGCYTTGNNLIAGSSKVSANFTATKTTHGINDLVKLDSNLQDGFGVRLISAATLASKNLDGLSNPSDGLILIYGQSATSTEADFNGSEITGLKKLNFQKEKNNTDESDALLNSLKSGGDVILSSCSNIEKIGVSSFNDATGAASLKTSVNGFSGQTGELSVSKLYASLYVLGTINRNGQNSWTNEKALLRYDIDSKGEWQAPQLLATGIDDTNGNGMFVKFGYVENCGTGVSSVGLDTTAASGTAAASDENFVFSNELNKQQLPAIIQVRLRYFTNKPEKMGTVTQGDADSRDYIINTTVRGGNTCVNRIIS